MTELLFALETTPKFIIWAIALSSLGAISLVDYFTGFELSLSLFFLFPISLAAWGIGSKSGLFMASVSAIFWFAANQSSGSLQVSPLIMYWNTVIRLGFFIVVTLLLTELRLMLLNERKMATIDPLTQALNRRAFYQIIENELNRAQRFQCAFSLLYLDLDNFKAINDQQGHDAGDSVLLAVMKGLLYHLRRSDHIARLGGDEFAVLLPETTLQQAKTLVPRLKNQLNLIMIANNYPVTFSIGVVTCTDFCVEASDLIKSADQLMYTAKRSGKNTISFCVDPTCI